MRNQYKVLQEAYGQVVEAHWGPNAAFLKQLKNSLIKEVDTINKTGSANDFSVRPVTALFKRLNISFIEIYKRTKAEAAINADGRVIVALDSPSFQNLLKNKSEENLRKVLSNIVHELIHVAQSKNTPQKYKEYGIWKRHDQMARGRAGEIDYINQKEELSTRAWEVVHWVVNNPKFANDFEGAKKYIINQLNNPTSGKFIDALYKILTPENKKYFIKTVYYYLDNWDKLKNA